MTVWDVGRVRPAVGSIRLSGLFTMRCGFNYELESDGIRRAKAETNGVCGTRETMGYLVA